MPITLWSVEVIHLTTVRPFRAPGGAAALSRTRGSRERSLVRSVRRSVVVIEERHPPSVVRAMVLGTWRLLRAAEPGLEGETREGPSTAG
ncbi:hypothetical protein GCM10027517_12940 [Phycicoccus ginsengisoli]